VKNLKISLGLLIVLGLFTLLLLLSSGLGLYFIKNSNHEIQALSYNSAEQKALSAVRDAIIHGRDLLDAAALAKSERGDVDVQQTVGKIRNELRIADEQFQVFWRIPGLSTTHPEIGASVKKAYEQRVATLARNSEILASISDPGTLKQMSAEQNTAVARDGWNNEYKSYMDTTRSNLDSVVNASNGSYKLAIVVMSLMLLIAIMTFFALHFWIRNVLVRPLETVSQHFNEIEKGDLTRDIHVTNRNEIGLLCLALQKMQAGLSETVLTIRQGVESINMGTQEMVAGNDDLSSRTEEQAAALEQTAASMEQISATVKLNTDNARQASNMINNTASIASDGEAQMQGMMSKMAAIRTSAQKMVEIISVIDGIAFQTNILALNAAVEAARAGQSGRGFAVVAGEVRNLAKRCTDSAKEITVLINESTSYIQEGAELADKTSRTISDISQAIGKVNVMMENIALASEEQNSGVEQIRVAITQMDQVTQQNAALVEEAATTASGVEDQSNLLSQSVAVFKLKR
jgi:methyl-accepting chemotaxis protein-4 (peptide sensor receptor)